MQRGITYGDPDTKPSFVVEPDFSVFATHPAVRAAMARITETTAEHVATQMAAVTTSAMTHASQSMGMMVSTLGVEVAAQVDHSASHAEHLHTFGEG